MIDLLTPFKAVFSMISAGANTAMAVKQSYESTSMNNVTRLTEVRPLTIISEDCISMDALTSVLQLALNIYTAYYLRTISYACVINDVRVAKIFDQVNPDRGLDLLFAGESLELPGKYKINHSAYTKRLENYALDLPVKAGLSVGLEAVPEWMSEEAVVNVNHKDIATDSGILAASNLAIGKLINVKIKLPSKSDSEKEVVTEVPVNVNLAILRASIASVINIITSRTDNYTLSDRWDGVLEGAISFFKDFVICDDMRKELQIALMKDDTDVYSKVMNRANSAKGIGLLTKNPSLNVASNIYIISSNVRKEIEKKFGGPMSSSRIRDKIFENTYGIIIMVMNSQTDTVDIYINGREDSSKLTFKEIVTVSKGAGPSITEILTALNSSKNLPF